jgi:sodium/hydrogen antiporter
MLALVVVMAIFLGWALVAGRLARWSVTAPIAMVAAGILLTAGSSPVFVIEFDNRAAERWVEVVLAVVLFVDATEVPGGIFGREPKITARLLGIALPLSAGLALLAGVALLPHENVWLLALLATVVIPTDLSPAAAMIRDRRVPNRLRQILNVESGLNDGLVAPVFLFCLAAAGKHSGHALPDALPEALVAILVSLAVGAAVGYPGGWLLSKAWKRHWTQPSALRLGVVALPFMTYGAAIVLHGNGFVAAFVAGVFFAGFGRELPEDALHLAEDTGSVLSLIVWFLFGQLVNQTFSNGIELRVIGYALLALTVVRIVPVMLSLIGSSITKVDALFLGWLGPRGMASIVFGLLAIIDLTHPQDDLVREVLVVTVLASIVLHGLSYGPIAAAYGKRAEPAAPRAGTRSADKLPEPAADPDDKSAA